MSVSKNREIFQNFVAFSEYLNITIASQLCTTFFFSLFFVYHFKAESKKALAAPFCCLPTISFAISRKSTQLCVFLSCDSYNDGHSISKHNNDCRRIPWCDIFHLGWLGSVKKLCHIINHFQNKSLGFEAKINLTFQRHELFHAIGHLVDYIKTAEERSSFGFFTIMYLCIQKYVKLFDPMSHNFVSYLKFDLTTT